MAPEEGIPKFLPAIRLRPPGRVIFPGSIFGIELEETDIQFLKSKGGAAPESNIILQPQFASGKDMSIGTLAKVIRFVHIPESNERWLEVYGVMRTLIDKRAPGERIFTALWKPLLEMPLSEEDGRDPLFQQGIIRLKKLFGAFIKHVSNKEFFFQRYAQDAVTRIENADRENLSLALDGVMNIINRTQIKMENGKPFDMSLPAFLMLNEQNPRTRLVHIADLMEFLLIYLLKSPPEESVTNGVSDMNSNDLPEYVVREIERWQPYAEGHSEIAAVHAQYIEWLLDLPWNKISTDNQDFASVWQQLNEDHYGLEEVKRRIVEFLAVRRVKQDAKGPILCLVGPPGVGKTSLGKSIARALGRKFVRRSLGGVKDEAALRGHRRTYVGAIPGIIIQALRDAEVKNPVFMLDEIDKLGEHGRDVPENVLLEILDPEQNSHFTDHYINIPFDLSQVFFICTANTVHTIHDAVHDRMEIIELPGYTEEEKVTIAKKHLVPRALHECGIEPEHLNAAGIPKFGLDFPEESLAFLARYYTDDAGMRETQRKIEEVIRKILTRASEGNTEIFQNTEDTAPEENRTEPFRVLVTPADIQKYLGKPKTREWIPDFARLRDGVGIVLMVRSDGVGILGFIEVSYRIDDHLDFTATGLLQEVLQESIVVALDRLIHKDGILEGIAHKLFLHFHFPDGATPKDGPSAGVQIPIALYSALLGIPVKPAFAATGEITLRRNVILPVGGISQKLLAAERSGIKEVAIPLANKRDLEELPKRLRDSLAIITPEEELFDLEQLKEISRRKKDQFTVYLVNQIEEVIAIAMPEHFPPHQGFIEEFNQMLAERIKK